MAMVFDSEEEQDIEGMLDESDDDDDDYVPDGGNSDSDPEYGKRKRRSSRSSPNKRSRSTRSTSSEKKSPSKTLSKRGRKPKLTEKPEKRGRGGSSLRRSSRSTRVRAVSYADADVSGEEYYDEEELFDSDESNEVYEHKSSRNQKKNEERKKHVDDLWSSFKNDVNKKDEKVSGSMNTESVKSDDKNDTTIIKDSKQENREVLNNTNDNKTSHNATDGMESGKSDSKEGENKTHEIKDENVTAEEKIKKETNIISKSDVGVKNDNKTKDNKDNEKNLVKDSSSSKNQNKDDSELTVKTESNTTKPPASSNSESESKKITAPIEKDDKTKTDAPTQNKLKETNKIEIPSTSGKVKITQVYDFAGEEIKISKEVNVGSKEAKQAGEERTAKKSDATKPSSLSGISNILSSGVKKSGGLSSVLGAIDKKKKISVLDKSKYDWDNYKSESGLEDELRSNRNSGYLDRQEFLQRVDFKQWENEREMRLYSNKK
ncbi:craniofacial development protein 1-like [Hydractinia symbiolongicarpus]|uniref:craniofacial development protein 1-like n=1 Tax=Hydractinia symbiolongicarpus TaxID=13093 RepID=UPI00254F704E|nr:craniofacial development protein 1-like [Hydractinia symbiolongicarpus]